MCGMAAVLSVVLAAGDGFLPVDGRWQYPHYLTFRPGDAQVCRVNPPRMSWPYLSNVLPHGESVPVTEFTLQLASKPDFAKPDHEFHTPYNFCNALPVLDSPIWHWRVGYSVGTPEEQWSAIRSFQFAPEPVAWDRRFIDRATEKLAGMGHPRLASADGDWRAWRSAIEQDELTGAWWKSLLRQAEGATRRPWWREFPKTDRRGESSYDEAKWASIGRDIAVASFAYRTTGDERFARAKELALALARLPKGGLASPEYHGASRKWPTQLTEYLALCYDWWYPDLTDAERKTLLSSIDWRLRATFLEKHSWRNGDRIARSGPAMFCQSHPYENFVWSLPGVLLTAGDLEVSDELVPLCLNYLTGVTSAHGPDEGWNEGLSYGNWKGQSMLQASIYTALLLPELELGNNPCYDRLGQWYRHLLPLGIKRLSFGDYAANPESTRSVQSTNFRFLAWLTGDSTFAHRWRVLAGETGLKHSARPWLDLFCAGRLEMPEPAEDEPTSAVFPEAGWVMESTAAPSNRQAFEAAAGMIFKCRSRGGYSHSYRAENDFVWYALGQTLSASGGGTAYPDPHSRHSLSHNVVLVDGVGQEWNAAQPKFPFVGRLLAYRKTPNFTHWVGDATYAYQTVPGLLRVHRHVVFVDGRWFVLFDDLAVRPETEPVRFSWLYHVAPQVALGIQEDPPGFEYSLEDVNARVCFANRPDSLEIVDMAGRQGFTNVVTGEDLLPNTLDRLKRKSRELPEEKWMAHNLWVTNREPARQWTVLAVLTAVRDGDPSPSLRFPSEQAVCLETADGRTRTVSFDRDIPADISIDLQAVRAHAAATAPATLPTAGPTQEVTIDGDAYHVQWLVKEDFEEGLSRWAVEGNAEVAVVDGRLRVRNLDPEKRSVATVWFRPELPQNVLVRFLAKPTEPAEGNAANINLFLHARELDGSPVRFGRSGAYKLYHEIPNYIITLTGGCRPGWSRARRDPGFNLLHEADVRSDVGTEYAVTLTFQDGRLRYYLNGKRIHNVVDPDPLPAGRFAIRTWSTNAWWDDVEFGRLVTASPNTVQ